ncbi:hypothetical protein BGX30_014114 [Mortierella sp. GBA39]|nr:hypothetical protein BGX30_014114 [Mortierella sp. GBA39]
MPKPLYYLTNKDRFRDFQSRIIYIVLPPMGIQLAFDMGEPQEGDWFIVSDLGEIPRKSAVLALHGSDSTEPEDQTCFSGHNKDVRNVIP